MNRLLTYVRRHHLGLLALFIALGGTSYAAVKLPNNSVGSAQIRTGAVGSSEVRDGSLTTKDFKKGTLPAGAAGAQGPAGPQGPKGETGAQGEQGPAGKIETIAVRAQQSGSTQTIPNDDTAAGIIPVTFSSTGYDTSGFFDAARTVPDFMSTPIAAGNQVVRIPKTGLYSVNAGVRWQSNPTGVRSLAILSYATTTPPAVIAYSTVPANTALNARTAQNVSTTDRFSEGDFVLLGVGQSSGGDLLLQGSQKQIHLAVTYLGP